MERNRENTAGFALATAAAAVASLLLNIPAASGGNGSALFGYVGQFRAVSGNLSYSKLATMQSCNKLCCCFLCAADDLCVGANYRIDSSQCTLLSLAKWQLEPDSGYMLLLKGAALSNLEMRKYRTLNGSLNDSVQMANRGNYSVSMVYNLTQCQFFCEMQASYCYAYQFDNVQLTCKVFVGNYTGDYLPIDLTDATSSFSYHFRLADGPYRILPGAYPKPTVIASYIEINIMDSLRCRQLCESQSTNCSLFAYNIEQSLCYISGGDASPNLLSFDFTAVTWTSYYHFRNGSAAQECSTSYYFVTKSLVRDAAEQYCISSYGAQLAKIESPDEHTFVTAVIKSTAGLVNNNFWLGAKSMTYPYDFRWSCGGTNITFSAWHVGEPNNLNEFCVHMWGDCTWNNAGCTSPSFYFICEECRTAGC